MKKNVFRERYEEPIGRVEPMIEPEIIGEIEPVIEESPKKKKTTKRKATK